MILVSDFLSTVPNGDIYKQSHQSPYEGTATLLCVFVSPTALIKTPPNLRIFLAASGACLGFSSLGVGGVVVG